MCLRWRSCWFEDDGPCEAKVSSKYCAWPPASQKKESSRCSGSTPVPTGEAGESGRWPFPVLILAQPLSPLRLPSMLWTRCPCIWLEIVLQRLESTLFPFSEYFSLFGAGRLNFGEDKGGMWAKRGTGGSGRCHCNLAQRENFLTNLERSASLQNLVIGNYWRFQMNAMKWQNILCAVLPVLWALNRRFWYSIFFSWKRYQRMGFYCQHSLNQLKTFGDTCSMVVWFLAVSYGKSSNVKFGAN